MVSAAYWSSPAVASKTGEVQKLLTYLSLGIFAFDLLNNAKFDWSIISGTRQRRWPQLLYFGTKLTFAVFIALDTTLFWLETEVNCQSAIEAVEWSMGAVVIMSSCLLACRTVCVFFGTARKVVTTVIVLFAAGLTAAWMHGVLDVTAAWNPAAAAPWNSGACAPTSIKPTYFVKYVVTIVFDVVILALTTIGILRMNATSRIGEVLIKHGVIYFVLTALVNLVITVLTILHLSPAMSLIAAAPQSLICVIASTRLYRDLVEEASPKNVTTTSQQTSNNSSNFSSKRWNKAGSSSPRSQPTDSSSTVNDMEKGLKTQFSSKGATIHIHQERQVSSEPVPQHLQGHPFTSVPEMDYNDPVHTPRRTSSKESYARAAYPRLFSQSSPSQD